MGKQLAGQAVSGLLGVVAALIVVWLAFTPSTVTRGELTNYVDATAVACLKEIKTDIRDLRLQSVDVVQRMAALEAVVRTNTSELRRIHDLRKEE